MSTSVFKSVEGKEKIMNYYDKILSEWEAPYEELFIPTDFGETHVIESGDKMSPPIFLFHGSATNALMWTSDMQELRKDFRVFAVDILGEPGKSSETRLDLKSDENSRWINNLMEQLKVDKAFFMGNSLGGWMVLDFALRNPLKVSKLVLIASSGIMPVKMSFVFKSIFFSVMGKKGMKKLGQEIYGGQELPEEVVAFTHLVSANFKPRLGALPLFKKEALIQLTMPVLYIGGEHDITVDTEKTAGKLKNAIPNATTMIIKNSGHVLFDMMDKIKPFLLT